MSDYRVYRKNDPEYSKEIKKKILKDPRISIRFHRKDGRETITAFSHWINEENRVTRVQANIPNIEGEKAADRMKRAKDAIMKKLKLRVDKETHLNVDLSVHPSKWSQEKIQEVEDNYLILKRLKILKEMNFSLSYQKNSTGSRSIRAKIRWPVPEDKYWIKQIIVGDSKEYSGLTDPKLKYDATRKLEKELLSCITFIK